MTKPTQEEFAKWLRYDPETGHLIWRACQVQSNRLGTRAGGIVSGGYRQVYLFGKKWLEHRVAWLLYYGCWPPETIDHINGDKADNRLCNLRLASSAENNRNVQAQRARSSSFKGVWRNKKKWVSYITIDGRRLKVGSFDSAEAAAIAYDARAIEHFGRFAFLNFPRQGAPI
jgi:hypothetical protein